MLRYIFYSLTTITILTTITRCASISAPTGGPKDTIPPTLIHSIPLNKSINFREKTITLEFDEHIKADKLSDQLIITPTISGEYEEFIKKNIIKISFEDFFADSTTYTLNFREGLQDITESNPTIDNRFTFSTGTFIDSMKITGTVLSLMEQDTVENAIVGLYRTDDTVTIYNGVPYYFSQTTKNGAYNIENIKNGHYLIYAFNDANKNLKLDFNSEAYTFLSDTLVLDSMPISKNFCINKLDLTTFKQTTALPSGRYYEVNFNKYVTDFTATLLDSSVTLYSNLAKQNKSIRFYNHINFTDSVLVSFSATDSLNNSLSDSTYVKFTESRRKVDDFTLAIKPPQSKAINPDFDINITFSKPVLGHSLDSLYFEYDTITIYNIPDTLFQWNNHRDKLTIPIILDKAVIDTLIAQQKRSAATKTVDDNAPQQETIRQKSTEKEKNPKRANIGLRLYIGSGTFVSADLDSNIMSSINYKFIVPENVGTQEINISTQYHKFTVQLLTEKFELVAETANSMKFAFNNIEPGKYRIRVLIDTNADGFWSPGNMLENKPPEPIYIYPEILVIRADWKTKLDLSF